MLRLPRTQRTSRMAPGRLCLPSATHRLTLWLAALFLVFLPALPALAAQPAKATATSSPPTIPMAQLGVEADKQDAANASRIQATATGAELQAPFQDLEGVLGTDGLWLRSTSEARPASAPFRVMATALGRAQERAPPFTTTGAVQVDGELVRWVRPAVVEEYSVSTDGVRQDFLLLQRPTGAGQVRLDLAVTGATAATGDHGLHLTLADGRELVYGQLHVTDAAGRVLPAQMHALAPAHITILVDDHHATWPLRIDPTFSDADWVSMGGFLGTNGQVRALVVSGSDLYVGGSFTAAGDVIANNIAKWNGSAWSPLGAGVNGWIYALATSGSDLYVGGSFTSAGGVGANYIAKWNGSDWSPLSSGVSGTVRALATSGSDLYVGGEFTSAGSVIANNIAKWNGNFWSPLGSGVFGPVVFALAVSGSDLYVGGSFTSPSNNIAKWNGNFWSPLGSGVNSVVFVLAMSGNDLYVGGEFSSAGGVSANRIAKWNGSTWSPLGTGVNGWVNTLAVSGSNLYVGGRFNDAGGVSAGNIAKWNGSAWSALGSGINNDVYALTTSGSDLYVGGRFNSAGGVSANNIAKWNSSVWSALSANGGVINTVYALATSGSDLYVGGEFTSAGGVAGTSYLAKWNGSAWSALGSGVNSSVRALATSGSDLYVGGEFTSAGGVSASRIAKWNGSAWSPLGTGVNGWVNTLAVSGSDLYVGGEFTSAGGVSASRIAKWNGSDWSPLGAGVNSTVRAIAVSGSDLYVGGHFSSAGGVSTSAISKWNGNAWSPMGTGVNSVVYALATNGSDLYVGGQFTNAGGVSANRIAKWNGSAWSALGTGVNSTVLALAVNGNDLYVGGAFTTAGGKVSAHLAKAQLPSPAPEIAVAGNGNPITSGDSTPDSSDHTDFGAANVNSGTVARTFTVQNNGDGALTGVAATVNGNAAFSLSSTPAATVNAGDTTTFQVTFAPSAVGVVTATVSIASNDSDENPYTFVIRGDGLNNAPTANDGNATTAEESPTTITLVATDDNNDPLSYTIVSQPLSGTVTVVGNVATYTPTLNFAGTDSFTFKANDGTTDSNVATIQLTVSAVNDAPVADDGSATTDEGTPVNITLVANDGDGDALTYTLIATPMSGIVTLVGNTATYTPTGDTYGNDSFTFQANDGVLDSNIATVNLTVNNLNDAPVAENGSAMTAEDTTKTILLSAYDVDGDSLVYTIVSPPSHGTVTVMGITATYTPTANYHGSDSFTFKTNDGTTDSNVAMIQLTVNAVNDAPVATDGSGSTSQGTPVNITLVATDVDDDPLIYTLVAAPSNGIVTLVGNTATYTPTVNYYGSDSFTFRANDGALESNVATVTLMINGVNTTPQTRILTRPLNPSTVNVSFGFDGSDGDGTVTAFECKLDSAAFTPCSSPQSYSSLSVGRHTFQVRAVDNEGAVDPTPARYTWDVATSSASVTIELAMTPEIASNVRFTGSLGTFYLDDSAVDDGDAYSNSKLFTVAAGSYTVNQRLSETWHLLAIACTPTAAVVTDLANKRVTINVVDGDAVTCRFEVQRTVNLYARAYHDLIRNGTNRGRRNVADPYLAGIGMTLYLSPTNSVAESAPTIGVSAIITEARFLRLPAGAYVVCATFPTGWTQTDPNPASPLPGYPGQACKSITLAPGNGGVLLFGQYPSTVVSSAVADENDAYEADAIFALPLDEWVDEVKPEEDEIIEEGNEDDETVVSSQRSFLPLVLK